MAAPVVTGGYTELEACDDGFGNGTTPSTVLSGSTPSSAPNRTALFSEGINATGAGIVGNNSNTSSLLAGIYSVTSTDFTVSNRLCVIHSGAWISGGGVDDLTSSAGAMLYVNSGSTGSEEAAYALWGADALVKEFFAASVVNLNRSTNSHLYSGTFDPSDVTHIGLAVSFQSGFSEITVESIGYIDPYVLTEGDATTPADFADITAKINTDDANINESPTGNIHHCYFGWGAGNGTVTVYVRETLKTFEFARTANFSEPWGRAHINNNDLGFEVNAASDTNVVFELCNWISDTPFYWNSIGNTSPTQVKYISCIIQNAGDLTIVNGHEFIGTTFDSCATIAANNPTLTNCSIKNATGVALDLDPASGANITNTTFSGNQTAIRIDTAGSTTFDARGCNFDTDNTYYIEYTGTGTLTVTTDEGIAPAKLNASGGGTIDAEKSVTVSVTCKDASDNSVVESARVLLKAESGGALPSEDTVTITRSGSTATVTHTAHGLSNGDEVIIEDADQEAYNGIYTISNVTTNTYDYTVSGTPTTPATGSIISTSLILNALTNASGVASTSFIFTADQPIGGWSRKPSGTPPFKQSLIQGTINSSGFNSTQLMIRKV